MVNFAYASAVESSELLELETEFQPAEAVELAYASVVESSELLELETE